MIEGGIFIGIAIGGAVILVGGAEYLIYKIRGSDQVLNGAIDDFNGTLDNVALRCTKEVLTYDASRPANRDSMPP